MKSTAHKSALAKLIFQNTGAANIGDATGLPAAATAGNFYFGLHSAWPGLAGSQSTSELSYSGYARQAAARSSGGFTESSGVVTLTAALTFPTAGAGASGTALFWSMGSASSGTGNLFRSGGLGGIPVPCTMVASSDVVTSADLVAQSTGLTNGDSVCFWSNGGTVPSGLTEGTRYYVISVSGNTFSVSTSVGGAAVNITADGSCYVQRLTPVTIAENVQPVLSTSTRIEDA